MSYNCVLIENVFYCELTIGHKFTNLLGAFLYKQFWWHLHTYIITKQLIHKKKNVYKIYKRNINT